MKYWEKMPRKLISYFSEACIVRGPTRNPDGPLSLHVYLRDCRNNLVSLNGCRYESFIKLKLADKPEIKS